MDISKLKTLIDSEPSNLTKTDQQVLDWLNSDSTTYHERLVNARQLMAEIGANEGAVFLDKLDAQADPAIVWAMKFLTGDGIDVGNAQTRGMLDQLAATSIITTTERDAVKGLATVKTISEEAGLSNPKVGHVEQARVI